MKFQNVVFKTALSQTIFKQQRNRVNNLKKQLKEKFYTNVNENFNELKTINSKTYWKIINTLLKGESTMNDIPPILIRTGSLITI
jgi:hypothetical protein